MRGGGDISGQNSLLQCGNDQRTCVLVSLIATFMIEVYTLSVVYRKLTPILLLLGTCVEIFARDDKLDKLAIARSV